MAIVKTIKRGGATVHIDDSCCAGLSTEEIERRRAQVDRIIWQILRNSAKAATFAATKE